MKKEIITGKFQSKAEHFGFVIPEERSYWGGDFFVHKDHFNGAKDGNQVKAQILLKSKGKKPEAKILHILTKSHTTKAKKTLKTVTGIYTGGDGDFGFVDIEGQEKGYFVHNKNKNQAKDGDTVKAEIINFKGKSEAIVVDIIKTNEEFLEGTFKDNGRFGFVLPNNQSEDIFIAGSRKGGAKSGDKVQVRIIKKSTKSPEGIIQKILESK